jgi:hypothetical protein
MPVIAAIDWSRLLREKGIAGNASVLSFKLYEPEWGGADPLAWDYAGGKLVWRLSAAMPPLTSRSYFLYFSTTDREPVDVVGRVLEPGDRLPGVNLVRNGDFEEERAVDSLLPAGWRSAAAAFRPGREIQLAPGEGPDGSTAVRLVSRRGERRPRARCQSQLFAVKPGARYFGGGHVKLTASERGATGYGVATIGLQFLKADKTRDWRQRAFISTKFVSGEWLDVSKRIGVIAPADARWAAVYLDVGWHGPAEALFDDIRIVEVPHGGPLEVAVQELEKRDEAVAR